MPAANCRINPARSSKLVAGDLGLGRGFPQRLAEQLAHSHIVTLPPGGWKSVYI